MATSRTGTAQWKRTRAKKIAQAKAEGVTNCPTCGQWLDYSAAGRHNSVEVDHSAPYAVTGVEVPPLDELEVICRGCNGRKGGQLGGQRAQQARRSLRTSQQW